MKNYNKIPWKLLQSHFQTFYLNSYLLEYEIIRINPIRHNVASDWINKLGGSIITSIATKII